VIPQKASPRRKKNIFIERRCTMRNVEIVDPSWSVDEAGDVVSDQAERLESDDDVEAASINYSYARI
jgi:hypothetical protein